MNEDVLKNLPTQDLLSKKYNYQEAETEYLDSKLNEFKDGKFSYQDLYEIMLWKNNRFPTTKDGKRIDSNRDILEIINKLAKVEPNNIDEEDCKKQIKELMSVKQFELPMISTILSFVNPDVFQIIDRRTNRIVMGDSKKYRKNYSSKPEEYYFKYLNKLRTFSKVDFSKAGRIFYQLDIELGNKLDEDKPDSEKIKQLQKFYK